MRDRGKWIRLTRVGELDAMKVRAELQGAGCPQESAELTVGVLQTKGAVVRHISTAVDLDMLQESLVGSGASCSTVPDPVTEMIGESDGRQVWINASDGCCIARFGARIIDIHHTGEMQMQGDQCLNCRARSGDLDEDWSFFVTEMWRWYGYHVPANIKPSK